MKIRASQPVSRLTPGLLDHLYSLRALRNFQPAPWITAKCACINHYFLQSRLSCAVLGVSGGVDSSLVAALLVNAARQPGSPIERIILLALPAHGDAGVTGQSSAVDRARMLADHLGLPLHEVDVAPSARANRNQLSASLEILDTPWASGQGIAIARTQALYQAASLASSIGQPALVVGTTNRDEGAWLGYVGKASDGMVDIQPISDLHKSEVIAAARALGLPAALIDAEPTGDMFDACPDTAVFGAPYDAVELLILSRTLPAVPAPDLTALDHDIQARAFANLADLHAVNAHKYNVGSPAVHLDLMEAAMPGGWRHAQPEPFCPAPTVVSDRPAPRALLPGDRAEWFDSILPPAPPMDGNGLRLHIKALVNQVGLAALVEALQAGPWQASDRHGQWRGGVLSNKPATAEGSWRTTIEDPALAHALFAALRHHLPPFRQSSALSRFDGSEAAAWRPVGINPVFRAMAYAPGAWLVPHYDGPVQLSPRLRTAMSVVIYLTRDHGGGMRFLVDPAAGRPIDECDLSDHDVPPDPGTVEWSPDLGDGDVVVFDHFQLHDAPPVQGPWIKYILRTDVIFEKVGP